MSQGEDTENCWIENKALISSQLESQCRNSKKFGHKAVDYKAKQNT
jgi:hypothetical protein